MMGADPKVFLELTQRERLAEAEHERLLAQLPRPRSELRRELALACYRLANWLDDPSRYFQPSESGRVDWARIR